MLGDAYGAAIVEALSKKELDNMDKAREQERLKEMETDVESGHETIVKNMKKVGRQIIALFWHIHTCKNFLLVN